jgi:hypothetical protein
MKVAELLEGRTADDLANIMPLSYRAGKGHTIEAYGRKGMKNTKWRKFFKNSDAMSKWCDDNDATVEGSRELDKNELREGWKMGAAAVGLSAAVVAGIANSPKVEINGETYDKAMSLRSAPDDAKSATVSINGEKKKVLYWEARSGKHMLKKKVYAIQEELNEDVIEVEEAGWYVCDYKERPVHGPMSEMKAKAFAEQLSVDGKKFSAEYFSDYEIERMNEAKEVHPMDKPGMRKKYLAYVAQMKKLDKPYKSYGSWALYNDTKV